MLSFAFEIRFKMFVAFKICVCACVCSVTPAPGVGKCLYCESLQLKRLTFIFNCLCVQVAKGQKGFWIIWNWSLQKSQGPAFHLGAGIKHKALPMLSDFLYYILSPPPPFLLLFIYLFTLVEGSTSVKGSRTTCKSWFSPSTLSQQGLHKAFESC